MRGVFEGISGACTFPQQHLFIQGFVALRLPIKCPLANWLEGTLFGAFEVLSVGPSFGRTTDGVEMSFSHLMNERNGLWCNLSGASTVAIAGKQPDKATPILELSLTILLLPILPGPFWNSSPLLCCAFLFLIIILFRVNDPITEKGCSEIDITSLIQQYLAF